MPILRLLVVGYLIFMQSIFAFASDNKSLLTEDIMASQICNGMYAKDGKKSEIKLNVDELKSNFDGAIRLLIFNWKEVDSVGLVGEDQQRHYICDYPEIEADFCSEEQYGLYLVDENKPHKSVFSDFINAKTLDSPFVYPVDETGLYCVFTAPLEGAKEMYTISVTWENYFGELDATEYPHLFLNPALLILNVIVSIWWSLIMFRYRHDLLQVQKYISGVVVLSLVCGFISSGYFFYANANGYSTASKVFAFFLSIFQAARQSYFGFLVLIVSLGYSIVVPTLGSLLRKCQILGALQFVALSFFLTSLFVSPNNQESLVLMFAAPIFLFTIFAMFFWIVLALNNTIQDLRLRKQTVKAQMYTRLWVVICFGIIAYGAIVVTNAILIGINGQMNYYLKYWKLLWFLDYGYADILSFILMVTILYIWRPTENNRRFAMSEQVAQDVDEFEMTSSVSHESLPIYQEQPGSEAQHGTRSGNADEHQALFAVDDESDDDAPYRVNESKQKPT
ncbi:seven transmembrane receptor-like protein [Schizosaccharomyces cryophilus OY26]|uniref:Seven transmembrane receptor-like protein n=1 Tax=Schizosaccharomyces cryophilus (strain OY26 / ATCC MYA-4695 / CBS 11777 / NBRC 106824 / NRRL Y48691) TaxID=653667 RepID=S9X2W6_SCHCR|nr:seven transmembrane receptor-like protein [Schizosaccharomyces cryophilus OY26]EPY51432.1 seven transmembrane receptor-like protein [Schizosaccharomyces cryophilus OY26]